MSCSYHVTDHTSRYVSGYCPLHYKLLFFFSRLDNYEIKAQSLTPEFKFEADYVMDGHILVLPVKGKGKCIISLGKSLIHRCLLKN